jgi:hypothetical protein
MAMVHMTSVATNSVPQSATFSGRNANRQDPEAFISSNRSYRPGEKIGQVRSWFDDANPAVLTTAAGSGKWAASAHSLSGKLWFLTAAAGQLMFIYYILVAYVPQDPDRSV